MKIDENEVDIGHEATVSKIGEEQLFYLMSRGLSEPEASALIVSGLRRADTNGASARVRSRDEPADPAADGGLGRLIDAERVDFIGVPVQDLRRADEFYGNDARPHAQPALGAAVVEYETSNVTLALIPAEAMGPDFEPKPHSMPIALRVADVEEAKRSSRRPASSSPTRSSTPASATSPALRS